MLPGDLTLMAESYPEKAPLDPTGEIELSDMLYYALDIRSMEAVSRFLTSWRSGLSVSGRPSRP